MHSPECRQIESWLPPFVDGEADAVTRRAVEAHLACCAACRSRAAAEHTARVVLRARARDIADLAPPGLRTRIAAALGDSARQHTSPLGWVGRLTAFAAAAVLVLVVGTGLELITPRSDVLYATQLAIDHMRCFVVELARREPADPKALQKMLSDKYGWTIDVPPSNPDLGLTLIAARRCPYWVGEHAHLLYRWGDHELSLYVTAGGQTRHGELRVLGHQEKLWNAGGKLYTIVADDVPPEDFARISAYLERETAE